MVRWCKITMLSDEEKKAMEILRKVKDEKPFVFWFAGECYNKTAIFDILLNLIEKQSKEIEELKNITKSYDSFLGNEKIVIADKKFFVNGYFRENYVSKDKIKAKIEELEKEQEDNRKVLYNAINNLYFKEIDIISNKISVNMSIRDVLQSFLEKE